MRRLCVLLAEEEHGSGVWCPHWLSYRPLLFCALKGIRLLLLLNNKDALSHPWSVRQTESFLSNHMSLHFSAAVYTAGFRGAWLLLVLNRAEGWRR